MIRILVSLSLMFTALVADAHEQTRIIKPPLTSDQADVSRHCVYNGQLFSRGAVIKQASGYRICEKVSFGAEPFMLGWDEYKK